MTVPNFGGQPGQGQQQQGWSPPQQQFQQPQQPQNQPFNPQTTVIQPEPHLSMPQPYFPPPQQQGQPQQQQQMPSQQLYPNAPQYAPAWQGGQQVQQGQPQQQPWQQQQQQQAQQRQQQAPAAAQQIQYDAQGRMFGPGLPQELQGKTMQEAAQIYGMMRQAYVQTQQQPQQQRQQQQPTPTQQGQVQANARPSSPWTDPDGFFGKIIEDKLNAVLGPVVQTNAEQRIETVRNQIAAAYPVYLQHEAAVLQKLQGLPIETITDPAAWKLALSAVIGEQQLAGGQQQRPQQNGNGQPQLPWGSPMPIATLPWQQANQPQQHQSFFTESPSAVMQGGYEPGGQFAQGQTQLTPQQLEVARRFGISPQQYLQGMGIR